MRPTFLTSRCATVSGWGLGTSLLRTRSSEPNGAQECSSCVGSASVPVRDSAYPQKLKNGTFHLAESDHVHTISAAMSASAVYKLASCPVQQKHKADHATKATVTGSDIVAATRGRHTLPRRQLVVPAL